MTCKCSNERKIDFQHSTPKIPWILFMRLFRFWHNRKNLFSQQLEYGSLIIGCWRMLKDVEGCCRMLKDVVGCWSHCLRHEFKIAAATSSMESAKLWHSYIKFLLYWSLLSKINFITPNFKEIRQPI
jgi:hypothetical protein